MKTLSTFLALLLSGCSCFAERVIFLGFDLSATAWRGEGNPYDGGLQQVLITVEGGDHVYGAIINEKGLANGAPFIDFGIRPYSFWSDKRNEYEPAVKDKLKMQREALANVLKTSTPSKKTEIIGFLHSVAQILNGYPAKTVKQAVIWTDGLQEGDEVDLARIVISDEQISKIIEEERRAGRLPKLTGVGIWFVTSPSVQSTQFTTSKLLRLEAFWRRYIQACGGEVKAFSPVLVNFGGHMAMGSNPPTSLRSNSPPLNKGAPMHFWPEEMELLYLNSAGDRLTLKDTFNGTIITGEKGCGKTSGSAAHLHACFLAIGAGGFLPCPKRTDARDYGRLISRWARGGDVIPMRPTHDWREEPVNAINILDAEQKLFGHGNANATNVTTLLMKVSDLVQRQGGSGATNEAFWREYAKKIIHAGLTGQSVKTNRFDLKLLLEFVNSLPNSLADVEEQSLHSVALMKEAKAKLGDSPPYDFMLAYNFVMREWPLSPPNTRASGALTVQVMLTSLLSHPLRQLLFEKTTFDLDRVLNHGGILLLDMNVDDYPQAGIAGMILKDIISRAAQVRPQLGSIEPQFVQPVYLLVDEYPEYAIDADEKHARMARSARLAPIFISQSTSSLKAQFQDKEKAQALLDLAGCRWAHQNGSFETNEWMAKTIGQIVVKRNGGQKGRNWDYGPQCGLGRNEGQNFNEQIDFDCPPRAFTRLLRGGPENGARTEAIFWRSGGKFDWNKRRWLPVVFQQDFKPGRDEVRITAQKKGGDNYASQHKSVVAYSASQNGWKRLRSLFK